MKLTAILLVTSLHLSAAVSSQTITFSGSKVPLEQVFSIIRQQTGFKLIYNSKLIASSPPVTISVEKMPLEDFLQRMLEGTQLEYTIEEENIVIGKKKNVQPAPSTSFFKQDPPVTGRIVNQQGAPLASVNIIIKGTNRGTVSDSQGYYSIAAAKGQTLVISSVAFETREIIIGDQSAIDIILTDALSDLAEVVVNKGYYSERKKLSTGSVSQLSAKQIDKQPVMNVLAAMAGSMPGVDITQPTGLPGTGIKLQIRGVNSVRAEGNDPLYVVDGIPFSSQSLTMLSGYVFGSNAPGPLNGINVADIESIEVLKDADATAIYGSRGANGVVLITTKKGRAGETSFFIDAYKGTGKVTRMLKLLNTEQYLQMRREAFTNDGLNESSPEYETAYDLNGTWDQTAYTDWQKQIIGGTAGSSQIQAGINGGSNNTRFLISSTLSKENTVFPGNYAYTKGSVHFNLNHTSANGKFSTSVSTSYVIDKNNLPGSDLTNSTLALPPNHPSLYKENGELNWEKVYNNPLAALESDYLIKNNTLTASGTLEYTIINGLQIKTSLGYNDNRMLESKTDPYTMYNPAWGYGNTPHASGFTLNNSQRQGWSIEPQLSWVKNLGKGTLNMLVGTTFQESNVSQISNYAYDFTSDELITNLSAAAHSIAYSDQSTYRYTAIFGRLNYVMLEKYILNLTARRDGSSRFGPGRRFGNFGAAGVAWIFSKEKMFEHLSPVLSFGKLKASYGTTGNDQIGDYQFLNTYSASYSNYDGIIGLQPTRLFNPDFSWETNKKIELGIDLGFLNDRITISASYYRNRSSNQLVGIPLPFTTGFSSVQANLNATVQNTGLEAELRTINITKNKFRWSTAMNITVPRNKLISFPDLEASTFSDYVIGKSLSIRKAYYYEGVNASTGIYQIRDVDGDGAIRYPEDFTNLIDLSRKFYGGLTSELTIGKFEFSLLFQFVKQTGLNYIGTWGTPPGMMGNQSVHVLDRWQKPGDEKTIQRYTATYGSTYNAYWKFSGSQGGLGDASFIRLKNLSVSYNLPGTRFHIKDCRIYIQAQNLFTITKYQGLDPESQYSYSLPPIRMITAGIKLKL